MPTQGGPDGEFEERFPGADELAHSGITFELAKVTGIGTGRLHSHVGLGREPLVLLERPESGLLAGSITVEGENDLSPAAVVGKQPPGHLDVFGTEGCTAGGYRRRDPCKVAGHHVRVPLHHHQLALLGDVPFGEVDAVEDLGFLVERGLRGVQVFGALVVFVELARTKTDGVPRDVPDRPDQPAAETVVDAAIAF
ncbi:hypothetical protein PJL18_03253 [Paenarthrobacter nicotinovorans]|nr:hypothetical protein [Paenarthrobacter nicotinovorans]